MSTINKFEEILSWKEARVLNRVIGEMIDQKKFEHNYRLINQIEGSAGSIMDNIAEGYERDGKKEFIQFLYIAKASCGELRSQLYRVLDRGYVTPNEFEKLSTHAKKISYLIQQLINYLRQSDLKGKKYESGS